MMLRKVLMILFFVPFVSLWLFSPKVKAAESISVSGDWEVEYEIDDSAVTETGGTAEIKLFITNTSSSNTIYYVSVDLGAGTSSHFYRNDPMLDLHPGLGVTLTYNVPIDADDVGKSMNMWVAMSQGDSDDVDGIGLVQVIIGEPAVYRFNGNITASSELVDKGDTVRITTTVHNTGTRSIQVEVLDLNDELAGSTILAPGGGISFDAEYGMNYTRTFSCKVKAYYVGTTTLIEQKTTNSITVSVREEENIGFDTSLSADLTEITPMTTVNFTVALINSGDHTISTFEIRDADGSLVASTESMASGASGSVNIPLAISESCDVAYSVKAIGSSTDIEKDTNTIHITVSDAATATPEPANTEAPTEQADETDTIQLVQDETNGLGSTNILLIVVIAVLLILVGVMAIFVIKMMKKQMNEQNDKKNSEE